MFGTENRSAARRSTCTATPLAFPPARRWRHCWFLIGQDAYTAGKGAIIALTRSPAVEYAPVKIRVNVICPGVVRAGITEIMWSDLIPKEVRDSVERAHLTRLGEPEDIAAGALHSGASRCS